MALHQFILLKPEADALEPHARKPVRQSVETVFPHPPPWGGVTSSRGVCARGLGLPIKLVSYYSSMRRRSWSVRSRGCCSACGSASGLAAIGVLENL
jgi:hypothetical protein